MKSLFDLAWNYANSNLGTAVVTSTIAYLLARGAREQELEEAKSVIKKRTEENKELRLYLERSKEQSIDLLKATLNEKFRHEQCLRDKALLRYAFDNSICFVSQQYKETSSEPDQNNQQLQ